LHGPRGTYPLELRRAGQVRVLRGLLTVCPLHREGVEIALLIALLASRYVASVELATSALANWRRAKSPKDISCGLHVMLAGESRLAPIANTSRPFVARIATYDHIIFSICPNQKVGHM
jgi:hypothetical protein